VFGVASLSMFSIALVVYGSSSCLSWKPCCASVFIACLMKLLCVWLGSSSAACSLLHRNGVVWLFVLRCTSNSLALPCSCEQYSDLWPCPSMCVGRRIRCLDCCVRCLSVFRCPWMKCRSNRAALCRGI